MFRRSWPAGLGRRVWTGGRGRRPWQSGRVLSEMRDRSGGPNWRMRLLAVVLALLLAAPLTALVVQAAARALDLAL